MYKFMIFLFFILSAMVLLSCQHPEFYQMSCKDYSVTIIECTSQRNTQANTENYAKWIGSVGQDSRADIVIFPESALTVKPEDGSVVPKPEDKVIPYKDKNYTPNDPMYVVSQAAAKSKTYVVINLHELVKNATGNRLVYNTNVAFDRNGTVIARYRKYNIYDEKVNKPDKAELSTFTTDFGVTFGMFTCFDILFKSPALDLVQQKNIKNIIFTSWWYGELPFLTASQVQDGWSYSMNMNLFASGGNEPGKGTTGSGMYLSRERKFSVMLENEGSWMFSSYIPVMKSASTPLTSAEPRVLKFLSDPSIPQSNGTDLNATSGNFQEKICSNGLCCNFRLKYTQNRDGNSRYKYRAIVYRGKRRFGASFYHDVAYCAVVLCTDGNCAKRPADGNYPISFDEITIDGEFQKTDAFQMPTTLRWREISREYVPLDTMPYDWYSYDRTEVTGEDVANVRIRLEKPGVGNLVTFGIFGRNFS